METEYHNTKNTKANSPHKTIHDEDGGKAEKANANDADDEEADSRDRAARIKRMREKVAEKVEAEKEELKEDESGAENEDASGWDRARNHFPRIPFPWDILPLRLKECLQQLARSCGTTATALPGVAFASLCSVLGSTIEVSPKKSWAEPLILWCADVRPSGSGKTPAARKLCEFLYQRQFEADRLYKKLHQEWQTKKNKNKEPEPERPRGYFSTDLTLEGLRMELSGHGGHLVILDELSSFVSAQNQYKKVKGNDRETWLALHDGKPARVSRATGAYTIHGARVNIFGGVQPTVWKKVFGEDDDGVYLEDGTVFRFLITFEGDTTLPLTDEIWTETNEAWWQTVLERAMDWADHRIKKEGWHPERLFFSDDARYCFFEWRNELVQLKPDLPSLLKGFLAKIFGYAVRFSGALHCLYCFSKGEEPSGIIDAMTFENARQMAEFYLGQIVDAACALEIKGTEAPSEVTPQMIHLCKTLMDLQPQLDSGRLAIGFLRDTFNENAPKELKIRSARAMGAFLRSCGLTTSQGTHNANGHRSVKCLEWDDNTMEFIERCLQTL
jgi:hypothetical protein